jgi:hypothetical protein
MTNKALSKLVLHLLQKSNPEQTYDKHISFDFLLNNEFI